mmetsp:Transcript_28844/g.80660  ORF Transcript_28844/g.80660 Transcript_28844/m.80660 type:complete len:213 (+) Transcript_28844:291-929(+)
MAATGGETPSGHGGAGPTPGRVSRLDRAGVAVALLRRAAAGAGVDSCAPRPGDPGSGPYGAARDDYSGSVGPVHRMSVRSSCGGPPAPVGRNAAAARLDPRRDARGACDGANGADSRPVRQCGLPGRVRVGRVRSARTAAVRKVFPAMALRVPPAGGAGQKYPPFGADRGHSACLDGACSQRGRVPGGCAAPAGRGGPGDTVQPVALLQDRG